jgi:GT2 family glycosyltransferase
MKNNLAILITSHNRKEKTLACLNTLFNCSFPEDYFFDVYLVDDGSTDGTEEAVITIFPQVNVIQGNGNLYWNKGMRLAWQAAFQVAEYDFYLWLNDDVTLDKDALIELLNCYQEALNRDNTQALIVGSCRSGLHALYSYGGRNDYGPIIPDGKIQLCKYINGNVVLVPKIIFDKIGNLSPEYTHAMGDNDYGLRVIKQGFNCYTTRKYIATCPINGISDWCNPATPLKKRLQLLHSPKGLNINEYIIFRKKFWGWEWIIYAVKVYMKVLFPRLYRKALKIL